MKKILFVTITLTFSQLAFTQVDMDYNLLEATKMLAVAQGQVEVAEQIENTIKTAEEDCPPEIEQELKEDKKKTFVLIENKKEDLKWSLSVSSTLTGPKEKLQKSFITDNLQDDKVGKKLDELIKTDYASYEDRLKAINEACADLNPLERIKMGSMFASRSGRLYNYGRASSQQPNLQEIILPPALWKSLQDNVPGGVCRDVALGTSQLLVACGFSPDQVSVKSYHTQGASHAITSIRTDGEEYTINWSELYTTQGDHIQAPDPNLINTGLYYSQYDPVTGKLIEQRRTDLASALKIVAGGTVADPLYTPQMLLVEAAYGGLTAKIFEIKTEQGDFSKGYGLSYQGHWGSDRQFLNLSVGGAYAKNERDIQQFTDIERTLNQEIMFYQVESKGQVLFSVIDSEKHKLQIAPSARFSLDMAKTKTLIRESETETSEDYVEVAAGATVYYDSDPIKAHLSAEATYLHTPLMYISENGKDFKGYIQSRYIVNGGVSWENDRVVVSGDTNMIISQLEKQYIVGTGIKDKKYSASCQAMYSIYNRNYGRREDYIVTSCQKDFSIKKVGVATVDFSVRNALSSDQEKVVARLGAKIKF